MKKWYSWKIEEILKKDFPEQLKKINNAPEKLFFRGKWNQSIFSKTVAIVGSRRMTRYGREVVEKFMPEIVTAKMTVVSGFMYGVDTLAHQKCLDYEGTTVAVLGGGLDILTPAENEDLYNQILDRNGLVISEYENNFKPTLWSFPQRNRIVSGLTTAGVLVVEAGMKSGSLVTAKIAREQGRKIFAIPGPINSLTSEGTNWLIKEGWAEITLNPEQITKKKIIQDNLWEIDLPEDQKQIRELLKREPMTIDEIARSLKKPAAEINLIISLMSMSDLVDEENGKIYYL